MTAEQLRNSILQEAISGRLVPQDPNDEPAEIVSTVPEDEVPFEIPSTWRWVNFFSVYTLETNLVDPTLYFDYNHIAPDNIVKKQGKLLKCNTVREDKVKSNNHLFHKGQIIYSKIRPLLRKAIIAPFDGLCSADMYPLSTNMDTQFALIYLLSDAFNNQVSSICASRVKMPKINKAELATIVVPLPPLAEQKRIVAKLEELLPIVEQYGKAQKELDELNAALPTRLRQSILQEAISGRLVPQDPNDEPASVLLERMQNDKRKVIPIQDEEMPYEIPGSWEWVNLGSIVSIITGKKDANFGSEDGTYDFFTCSNTPIKCKSYSYDGDYLIMPGNGANIGKVIHYKGKFEAYQRTYLLQGYGNFDLDYLKYHLMCNWKEYNQDKLYGSAIPYIKLGNLMSYPVALPPLAEQERIVSKIEELFEQIDKISK